MAGFQGNITLPFTAREVRNFLGIDKSREDKIAEFDKAFPNVFEQIASAPNEIEAAKMVAKAYRAASRDPETEQFFVNGIKQIAPLIDENRRQRKLRTFAEETDATLNEAGKAQSLAGQAPFRQPAAPSGAEIAQGSFEGPLRKASPAEQVATSAVKFGLVEPKSLVSDLFTGERTQAQQAGATERTQMQQEGAMARTNVQQAGATARTELTQQGAMERSKVQRDAAMARLEKQLGSREKVQEMLERGRNERAKTKAEGLAGPGGLKSTLGTLSGTINTLMKLQENPSADEVLVNNAQVLVDGLLVKAAELDPTIHIETDPDTGRRILMRGNQPITEEVPPEQIPAEAEKTGLSSIPVVGDFLDSMFGAGSTPSARETPRATTTPGTPATPEPIAPEVNQVQQEAEAAQRESLQALLDNIFEQTRDETVALQLLEEAYNEAGGDILETERIVNQRLQGQR